MDSPLLSVTMSLNSFSEMEKNVYKFSKFIVSLDLRDNIVPVYVMVSRKKHAVLLDIVKITHPPSPQFGRLVPIILNAKNVDLSNI